MASERLRSGILAGVSIVLAVGVAIAFLGLYRAVLAYTVSMMIVAIFAPDEWLDGIILGDSHDG